MSDQEFQFVSLDVVLELHAESLARFGGSEGIREPGLIESALVAAQNTRFYRNGDLFDVAAAYAFHLAESRAFVDGNKRTAVAAALTFLEGNVVPPITDDGRLHNAMIAIATRQMDKAGLAAVFQSLAQPI